MSGALTIQKQTIRELSIQKGEACSLCGIYFSQDNGYKVICKYCFDREEGRRPGKFKLSKYATIGE